MPEILSRATACHLEFLSISSHDKPLNYTGRVRLYELAERIFRDPFDAPSPFLSLSLFRPVISYTFTIFERYTRTEYTKWCILYLATTQPYSKHDIRRSTCEFSRNATLARIDQHLQSLYWRTGALPVFVELVMNVLWMEWPWLTRGKKKYIKIVLCNSVTGWAVTKCRRR